MSLAKGIEKYTCLSIGPGPRISKLVKSHKKRYQALPVFGEAGDEAIGIT